MGRQEDPALCGQLVPPLPSQEAGAAAELDKELPFAEPVGLHHLTEGLIGWQTGKEKEASDFGYCQDSTVLHLPGTDGAPGRARTLL